MKASVFLVMFLATLLGVMETTMSSKDASTKASEFKAPNNKTPQHVSDKWKEEDEQLWNYVSENVPAVLDHTGSAAFDEHLKGVQAVLRYWGAPTYVTKAGLFHSIYGTEGFQGFALPLSERPTIQNLIGEKAEKLCFLFCMVDRSTVDESIFNWTKPLHDDQLVVFRSRPELGRFEMTLTKAEWVDFIELTLADWLEQVEGAAKKPSDIFLWKTGEAYAYRRLAYKKMSQILSVERKERLSTIPKLMLSAVMGTEDPSTQHLVQPRTPPMSNEAAVALQALRDAGEDIPLDLSPQPVEELKPKLPPQMVEQDKVV